MTDIETMAEYLIRSQRLQSHLTDRSFFAQLLRDGRALTGQPLRELALEWRVHEGSISRWESELSAPIYLARRAIVDYLYRRVYDKRSMALKPLLAC